MAADVVEVPLAPDAVMERVRLGLGLPPKRILGFKVTPEYVGVIQGRRFEVWERRRQAVHLLGTVSGTRGGSRVELISTVTPRSRILAGFFFVVLLAFAYGMATLPWDRALPELTWLFVGAGVLAAPALFWWMAREQKRELHAFARALVEGRVPGP